MNMNNYFIKIKNIIIVTFFITMVLLSSFSINNITAEEAKYKISNKSGLEKQNITVNIPEEMNIYLGNTMKITMEASDKSAKMVSYHSSNEEIAKVVGGVVIAEKAGTASIVTTVLIKGKYYEFETKVVVKPGKVTVTAEKDTLKAGETARITTKVSKGVWNDLTYTSDNVKVAAVEKEGAYGIVKAVSEGTATITARLNIGGQIIKKRIHIEVVKAGKKNLPVSNPVNAKNYTADDDWQGSRVYFGRFEQDNDLKNGSEPILWRVLQVNDNTLLLLSEYGLACRNYHDTFEDFTWETSSVRAWLNGEFLDAAFTNKERNAIQDTLVSTNDNKNYKTDGGNDTIDKVYLLSYDEVQNNAYGFQSGAKNKSKSRQMKVTPAALVDGYAREDNGNTCWWLRSPGITNKYAAYVFTTGAITDYYFVGRRNDAVRPVIQVKLSSILFGDYIGDKGNRYIQLIAK